MAELTPATLLDATGRFTIANIGLNGYKSHTASPVSATGDKRTIWSFTVVNGDRSELQALWWERSALTMRTFEREIHVRVAALPVDKQAFGLIEFI